jgi:PAS domain S-box-containing protein
MKLGELGEMWKRPAVGAPGRSTGGCMIRSSRWPGFILAVIAAVTTAVSAGCLRRTGSDPLNPGERAFLAKHGPIRYAPDPGFPPLEFIRPDGSAAGITPDIMALIARNLRVTITTVRYPTWEDVLAAARRGEVDLLGTLTRTPERERYLDFSRPYLSVPYVLFVRDDHVGWSTLADVSDRPVGVVQSYGAQAWLVQHHPELHLVAVPDSATGLAMVATGKLDAMVETLPVGVYLVRERSLTNVRMARAKLFETPQYLAVPRGQTVLLGIVQKGLDGITAAERTAVFTRWTGHDLSPPGGISPVLLGLVAAVGLLLVAAYGVTAFWNLSLRRAVERTTGRLAESERRYRLLFERNVAGVYRSALDGRIIECNEAFARMFGFATPGEVTEVPAAKLYSDASERARFVAGIAAGGTVQNLEFRGCRRDGSVFWLLENAALVGHDAAGSAMIEGTVIDITDRKRAEAEWTLLAIAVEQASDMVVVTDAGGRVVYLNRAFAQTTGVVRDDAMGKSARALLRGAVSADDYRSVITTLARGGTWSGRAQTDRPDGVRVEIEAVFSPVRAASGEIVNYLLVARDVTHERALEERLRQSQKMEAVGHLAGGVAHDFNNLLQALLSSIQALRMRASDGDAVAGAADQMETYVKRGAALARQLLLFARREVVRWDRLDLNEVVAGARQLLERVLPETIAFNFDAAPGPLPVNADRGQLEQVLLNLVINAADAMPEGGSLVVRTLALDREHVGIEVEDTGCGIAPELQARVFEPFFTTKSPEKGTGLGLPVVHGIVAAHAGRVELRSKIGEGTTFRVVLPRAESAPAPSAPREVVAAEGLPAGRGERVLLVEDEDGARQGLHEVLTLLGYSATAVGSGEEALALTGECFGVLLTDYLLPGIRGTELAGRLKQRCPGLQVIVMSGYAEDEAVRRDVSAGRVRFLQKPFDMVSLARELRAAIGAAAASDGETPSKNA